MRKLPLLLLLLLLPALATAQEPPLPRERPAERIEDSAEQAEPEEAASATAAAEIEAPAEDPADTGPERLYQAACPAAIAGLVAAEMLEPIVEDGCGERSPLAITAVTVNGRAVPLSSPATLNCQMASALPDWLSAVDGYVFARLNTRIARVLSGTSYMCRGRNRDAAADISEHGFANALDVVGFELEDGRRISLPEGWDPPLSEAGRLLRFAHDAACARFTTTLGPEANAFHADHLHLDLGCHGVGCTARLCE